MAGMLATIVDHTRRRIGPVAAEADRWRGRALEAGPGRGFAAALAASPPSVIAEVKRRSPSRGPLAPDLDPAGLATSYAAGGATAISVLTEPEFFDGSDSDLTAVAAAVSLPVLRKDFTLHAAQIWQARAFGADAVLLIAAILDDGEMAAFLDVAAAAGLDALVEVHDATEARRAVALGATLVGVNNRDLTSFETDLATAERLAPLLEEVPVRVAESGIFTGADVGRMAAAGYQAVLVGESLVRSGDPEAAVLALRGLR